MTLSADDRMSNAAPDVESGMSPAVSLASRTALTSIIGYTEILIAEDDGRHPHRTRMLRAIEQNGHRLHDLITRGTDDPPDHLDGGDDPAGDALALEDGDQNVSINRLVERVRDELVEELAGCEPDVAVRISPALLARRASVSGLRLVAYHLLDNAIKYSLPCSPVEVHAQRIGDLLSLRVTDSGIGIPVEEHERVFERFYRSAGALERRIPGRGLGLTTVRNIVLRQGGEISLRSAPSVGTTVSVLVPIGSPVRIQT